MRFHALTFENLCSFYGKHTVDLDALCGEGGMFLIRGVTGAGKSTLLDAIALALYGRTARFAADARGPALEGEKNLPGETDPAHLMSRGTGASFAELEFSLVAETGVRERYRARWSRRRANGHPDGNLQPEKRRLARLVDGEWVTLVDSDNKAQCAAAFDGALRGLGFDDFQRTTMLAQFRFREFLDAAEGDRAKILERMTNSERFTQIGGLAAARYKLAEERVRALERDLLGSDSWTDEVRAEKEHERAVAVAERDARRRAHTAELERRTFWARLVGLEEQLARHREATARVEDERQTNAAMLLALSEHRRTARARACHAEWARLRAATLAAEQSLSEGTRARDGAEQEVRAQAEELCRAEGALDEASRRLVEQAPALDEAVEAWRVDGEKARLAVDLRARANVTRSHANQAEERLVEVETRLTGLREELVENERRRSEIPRAELLAASRERVATLVTLARDAEHDLGPAAAELTTVDGEVASHTRLFVQLEAALSALGDEESEALACVEAACLALDRETAGRAAVEALGALDVALEKSRERREHLLALEQALEEAERLRDSASQVERTSRDARGRAEVARGELAAAVADEAVLRRALEERARNLEVLVGFLGVLPQRHALEPERPCPVCGSEAHPYREEPERAPKLEETQRLHAQVEAAVGEARAALDHATSRREEAGRTEAREGEAARLAAARLGELEVEQSAAEARLMAARTGVDEALDARADVLAAREGEERRSGELRALGARIRELDAVLTDVKCRREAVESRRRSSLLELERERGRASTLVARQQAARDAHEAKVRDVERARQALEGELATLEVTAGDPYRGAEEAQRRLEVLDAVERSRRDVEGRLHAAEVARAGERASAEAARRALVEAERSAVAAESEAGRVAAFARGLLDGRRPEEVRAELEAALEEQRRRVGRARELAADARGKLEAARERAEERAEAQRRAEGEEHAPRAALEVALETLGVADDAALAALALSEGEATRSSELEQRLLAESDHARRGALEATAQLAAERARAPDGALDVLGANARECVVLLEARVREAADAADAASHRTGELEAELRRDDEARARRAGQQGELEEARIDRDHWRTVHDLIGVDGGKRFMLAVQSLNLERVLERANQNLRRFMPRYELDQVMHATEGPKLDFRVVDHGQAGQRRSSKSLSGGESFVVALALALGLASTRGGRLRMETLLIDEGFGTLDPTTLQVAISALSSLQAVLGVRIGLISHVDHLREAVPAQLLVEPIGLGRSLVRPA